MCGYHLISPDGHHGFLLITLWGGLLCCLSPFEEHRNTHTMNLPLLHLQAPFRLSFLLIFVRFCNCIASNELLGLSPFPSNFLFGTASSSYQVLYSFSLFVLCQIKIFFFLFLFFGTNLEVMLINNLVVWRCILEWREGTK